MTEKTAGKPLLQAVPPPTISPAEVMKLAKKDCDVWLELFFNSETIGAKLFGAFSAAVRSEDFCIKKTRKPTFLLFGKVLSTVEYRAKFKLLSVIST